MTVPRKHRKTGMKKGKIKMKKLMILAAIAAMATGAWAGDYQFKLTIQEIPQSYEKLTDGAACYLVNKDTRQVLGYASMEVFNNTEMSTLSTDTVGLPAGVKSKTTLTLTGGAVNYSKTGTAPIPGGYEYFTDNMNNKQFQSYVTVYNYESGLKDVEFVINFVDNSGGELPTTSDAYKPDNLMIAIYDPGTEGQDAYYQEFASITYEGGSSTKSLGATEKYAPSSVPEPTSAMLLLLGVAGLCLKRKVA